MADPGKLLQHERAIVLAALLVVSGIAWVYLLLGAGMSAMASDPMRAMGMAPTWTPGYTVLMFVMWASMMLAMMLPSAAPAILLVHALMRGRDEARVFGRTGGFVFGYLLVWIGFSLIATALQWSFDRFGWLSAGMASNHAWLTAALLVAAGLYQCSPSKARCLGRCRSPAASLSGAWRSDRNGPLLAGVRHGTACLGCCWALMGLLFVGGVMNIAWIALLALLVLLEKTLPSRVVVSRSIGAVLIVAGAVVLIR